MKVYQLISISDFLSQNLFFTKSMVIVWVKNIGKKIKLRKYKISSSKLA